MKNVNVEQLNLAKNLQVSAQITNDISVECRKNALIKRIILPQLKIVNEVASFVRKTSLYSAYDT